MNFGKPQRISSLLFVVLASIGLMVLAGFVVLLFGMLEIREDLSALRDRTAPRLIKLSQLSQEASATIAIAPALSARPARFEFETLLSRIKDKEVSQQQLIQDLNTLIADEEAAARLQTHGDLLMENLGNLTDTVSEQIGIRKGMEKEIEKLHSLGRRIAGDSSGDSSPEIIAVRTRAGLLAHKILVALLDQNSARFPRNRKDIDAFHAELGDDLEQVTPGLTEADSDLLQGSRQLVTYWDQNGAQIYQSRQNELSNDFRIKALVEDNALIANRLLATANNEFWRTGEDVGDQLKLVKQVSNFTLVAIVVLIVAFAAGNFYVWIVLRRRVFERLDRMRDAIQAFADDRSRGDADMLPDEIGEISASLVHYMGEIEKRESEMEQLSSQLAKYLSPQVYESIFRGKQEVKIESRRKKLTVFFSDIAGFTEEADRLQSEQLTQLLNHYLTEMSEIALEHGATIDKYVGDAILIFFGDPETLGTREDALACVSMAIAMRQRMHDLQDIWRQTGIERPLQIRMGIHTDYCTVGNFGSEDRMDYTIIGGAVNIASRLESLADPGEILISYETFSQVRDEIRCTEHGELEVRGIPYPVATFQVVDTYGNLRSERKQFSEHHAGFRVELDLDAMTSRDRGQARDCLERALGALDEDPQ